MVDLDKINAERDRLRASFLRVSAQRPKSTGRGVHHIALLSSDVERTIRFYQEVLGFPLTDIFENRDYAGSNHFFFDIGHGNLLAFFDFPDLPLGPYAEVLGGLHHIAISVERDHWEAAKERLLSSGVAVHEESGSSIYFSDPDGARLELLADPLGEMYGHSVG
ncbi:MAG TPA: VOC family protein [Acidimicrobiales bacterium]|nr:VOC family protein [Acidimicrobiales bacterium]